MTERPKRQLPSKLVKESVEVPRKWKDDEMKILLECLLKHGHKNFQMLQKCLPDRSLENIKTFMRTVYSSAAKVSKGHENLDFWLNQCSVEAAPWRDSIQIAQIIKYLSVDGLLENHPLPEYCQGIDFGQAYRLIYQALMGYPVQPVNQQTADFILETLADLNNEIKKETDAIRSFSEFLKKPNDDVITKMEIKTESSTSNSKFAEKKPLKVYERKKPKLQSTGGAPLLKILIQESGTNNCNSGVTKSFSVTVEGNDSNSTTVVDVPVVAQKAENADEQELLKSSSYNPFKVPGKWLEEPLYLNLKQKP